MTLVQPREAASSSSSPTPCVVVRPVLTPSWMSLIPQAADISMTAVPSDKMA